MDKKQIEAIRELHEYIKQSDKEDIARKKRMIKIDEEQLEIIKDMMTVDKEYAEELYKFYLEIKEPESPTLNNGFKCEPKYLRENVDEIVKKFRAGGNKGNGAEAVIKFVEADKKRLNYQQKFDECNKENNDLTKKIKELKKSNKKEDLDLIQKLKDKIHTNHVIINYYKKELKYIKSKCKDLIGWIPNMPDDDVPMGNSDDENVVIREG